MLRVLIFLLLTIVMLPARAVLEGLEIDKIKHLIAAKYNHNSLIMAICNEDIPQVKSLLNEAAEVTITDEEGISPLRVAVIYGNTEIIKLLLSRVSDIQDNILGVSQALGKKDVIELCESFICNARINKFKHTILTNHAPNDLIQAICADDIQLVKNLLDKGADINAPDNSNRTPLTIAVGCENKEMIQLLLHKGANVRCGLVLLEAIRKHCIEIALLLLQHDADANETSEDVHSITPIMYAVASDTYDYDTIRLIESLLKKGADINARCDSRVMGINSFNGSYNYAYDLSGGELNRRGRSVLMEARNLDIIKLLLDRGAEVNLIPYCYWGKMPLVQALHSPKAFELVSLLLKYGIDVNAPYDFDSQTPLIGAIKGGVHSKVIKLLLDNGAHVSVQDMYKYSPLMYAVARNDTQIVQLLLEKDADVTVKSSASVVFDDQGHWRSIDNTKKNSEKTALDIAKENGNQVIVQLLEQKIFGQKK